MAAMESRKAHQLEVNLTVGKGHSHYGRTAWQLKVELTLAGEQSKIVSNPSRPILIVKSMKETFETMLNMNETIGLQGAIARLVQQ